MRRSLPDEEPMVEEDPWISNRMGYHESPAHDEQACPACNPVLVSGLSDEEIEYWSEWQPY